MRAKEFIINIPISITMNSDGSVDVNKSTDGDTQDDETQNDDVFVPPLQQKIELMKAGLGKQSPVIDQLLSDDDSPIDQ